MDIILSKNAFTLCWKRIGFFRKSLRGTTLRSEYLASRYDVLEAEWLLLRALHGATLRSGYSASRYTVLEASASRYNRWEASADSSSQNLIMLSVCVIGNLSEAG